jgi:hypothetical protein
MLRAPVVWQLAHIYRAHCAAVGIEHARLFQKKENKLRLRAHDMRAFFVASAMFAGKDSLWITDRTGNSSLGMRRTYERDVRLWRELGEAPVDVAQAIPEVAAALCSPDSPLAAAMRKCTPSHAGFRHPIRGAVVVAEARHRLGHPAEIEERERWLESCFPTFRYEYKPHEASRSEP